MDIRSNQKATVWSCDRNENRKNSFRVSLSTYEGKDANDQNKYANWFADFVGKAYEKADRLRKGDHIILSNAKIENTYLKDKDKTYYNLTVFDYKMDNEEKE